MPEAVVLPKNDTGTHEKVKSEKPDIQTLKTEKTLENGNSNVVENGNEKSGSHGKENGSNTISSEDENYTVKLVVPGVDPFDLQVNSLELVQEIHQVLMDKEETCHRTCFSLHLNGQVLDNFAELKAVEGLQDGSEIRVVEEQYSAREARNHVKHVHDLLRSVELTDAYLGRDQMSLSFLNTITGGSVLEKRPTNGNKRSDSNDQSVPDYVLPQGSSSSRELPLSQLHPLQREGKPPLCVRALLISDWNNPPSNRRLQGDLLYLSIHTLEDKRLFVTACRRGFFVNQSTDEVFNPKPSQHSCLSHSLVDLLRAVSPGFKRNFDILLKRRAAKHPFERVPSPYQLYTWLSPVLAHCTDSIRKEEAFCSKMAYEENLPGQTRDWNEELQATRELPRVKLAERVVRDRAVFKSNADFVAAATRAAVSVVDGNIMPINPGENAKQQMFIWNNMFFSLGFDVKDHYKEFGGDAAAYAATASDLHGVRAYSSLDAEDLYTLGTAIIDYRGFRVTAQTIIPGILEKEQEQSVVYGSFDFGKTIVTHEKYEDLLSKSSKQLRIRPHAVLNENSDEKKMLSSVECKGIIGNDGRHYMLDLLRTMPPDPNFLPINKDDLSENLREAGYPRCHPHKLCTLRQELIENFSETRHMAFLRQVSSLFHYERRQLNLKKANNGTPGASEPMTNGHGEKKPESPKENGVSEENADEEEKSVVPIVNGQVTESEMKDDLEKAKKVVEQVMDSKDDQETEPCVRDIVAQAAKNVGSYSDNSFEIVFNPDVFQHHVKHAPSEAENLEKDKRMLNSVCEFLVFHSIPAFVQECLDQTITPCDGKTLTEAMHHRGINMRYLGDVLSKIDEDSVAAKYIRSLTLSEIVIRAAKHVFKAYMQEVDPMNIAVAVSHFLNCFLSSSSNLHTNIPMDDIMSDPHVTDEIQKNAKKKNKRKGKTTRGLNDSLQWSSETNSSVWKKIVNEVKEYYHYELTIDSVESLCEETSLPRCSFLRSFCLSVGIQLVLKDFQFDSRHRQTFTEDDILNLFPVVKHLHPRATDAYNFFSTGQAKISQGLLSEGQELVSEALNLLNSVYGPLHPDIASANRLLARLAYVMGDNGSALMYEQRAVLISERVHGVDSPNTATEYAHLALYCFACQQVSSALQLMYRTRYIAIMCHGEQHPEMPIIDTNIGLMLHAIGDYNASLPFLTSALELNRVFFGERSLKAAMSHHLLARAHSCRGDFRTALNCEKECFAIYKDKLGEQNDRTKESSDCLRHLTSQAVVFQKKMKELSGTNDVVAVQAALPPIQIQTPTHANILETLNLVNGIFFIQLSGDDLEKFRVELGRSGAVVAQNVGQDGESQSTSAEDSQNVTSDSASTETSGKPNGQEEASSDVTA